MIRLLWILRFLGLGIMISRCPFACLQVACTLLEVGEVMIVCGFWRFFLGGGGVNIR
jgi:hypothetical protein